MNIEGDARVETQRVKSLQNKLTFILQVICVWKSECFHLESFYSGARLLMPLFSEFELSKHNYSHLSIWHPDRGQAPDTMARFINDNNTHANREICVQWVPSIKILMSQWLMKY